MSLIAPPVEGRHWLTAEPTTWNRLRGRVVVVLFWSYGCEASLLAARRLQEQADRWSDDDVVVLAVHTPRFPFEDSARAVEAAVARHRIELPVVHDPDYLTWNRYNPEGWPAMAVVDRRGRIVGMTTGAADVDVVAEAVETALTAPHRARSDEAERSGDRGRSVARPKPRTRQGSTLAGPSGVAVSPGGRLAIADTGNDRLLIGEIETDLRTFRPEVEITDIDQPSAVCFGSDTIVYVIERASPAVLQLDLEHGTLDVLADEELVAPTDLIVDLDGTVVVADAGQERLLRIAGPQHRATGSMDRDAADQRVTDKQLTIGPIAGSGATGCRDGRSASAELAQPVGLARTDTGIAFCDAASSNVRLLTDAGRVTTVTGNNFYDWGLVDGPAARARFQRPTGICATADGSLVIVDTGNDRVRMLENRKVRTLGLAGLDHPSAVAITATGHLVVADTGNDRLVVADPSARTGWPLAVYPAAMRSVWEDSAV